MTSDALSSVISNFESEVRRKSSALEKIRRLNTILRDLNDWRNAQNGFCLSTDANTVKEKKIEIPTECKIAIFDLLEKYIKETISNLLKT